MLLRYEEKIDMVITNWNMSIVFCEYLFCGKRNFFFCDMAYWSIVFLEQYSDSPGKIDGKGFRY